jgi:hypothetical protein
MNLAQIGLACVILCVSMAFAKHSSTKPSKKKNNAVATFVMGEYFYGALALGQSLVDVGSDLERIAIVTPDMPKEHRTALSFFWKVRTFFIHAANT